jgi:hypothetical protein
LRRRRSRRPVESDWNMSQGPQDYPGYYAPGPPPLPGPGPGPGPQWGAPEGVLGYAIPQPSLRPTSATVIAIIGICYAGLAIVAYLIMLVGVLMIAIYVASVTPFFTQQIISWNVARAAIGLCVAGLLLAACIGLLRSARWSRRGMIIYAVIDLVLVVGVAAVEVFYVLPEQQRQLAALGAPATAAGFSGQYLGKAIWLLITAAFPIIVLVFMTRPNIREFYDGHQFYDGAR